MGFHTVLFDLDGTLLNTLDDLADSTNFALAECGYPSRTKEEVRMFVGNGVRRLMERACPAGVEEKALQECLGIFRNRYREHMRDKTGPYNGIPELLEALAAKGIGIAVVSNKFDLAVKELCAEYFGTTVPTAIGESEGIRKKPAPDTVLAAMKELGAIGKGSLYVGDSDVDVETAHNAGMPCAGVTWGFRPRAVLESAGADYLVDTPGQLLDLILGGQAR